MKAIGRMSMTPTATKVMAISASDWQSRKYLLSFVGILFASLKRLSEKVWKYSKNSHHNFWIYCIYSSECNEAKWAASADSVAQSRQRGLMALSTRRHADSFGPGHL